MLSLSLTGRAIWTEGAFDPGGFWPCLSINGGIWPGAIDREAFDRTPPQTEVAKAQLLLHSARLWLTVSTFLCFTTCVSETLFYSPNHQNRLNLLQLYEKNLIGVVYFNQQCFILYLLLTVGLKYMSCCADLPVNHVCAALAQRAYKPQAYYASAPVGRKH